MRSTTLLLLFFLGPLLSSCEQMEFTEFFELGPLRIMAVQADTPELGDSNSSTDVTMTLYVSDIDAGGRDVSVEVAACVDPGVAFGEEPTCEGSDTLNENVPDVPDLDTNTLTRFTGAAPNIVIPVPGNLLDGLSDTDKERGIDYLVTFVVAAGDERLRAYKRVHISTSDKPNSNPVLNEILVNGEADASQIRTGDTLDVTTDTPEEYVEIDFSGFRTETTETYLVSWFTYGGTTEFTRTDPGTPVEWEKAVEDTNFDYVFAVLRDGRGGIDVRGQEY